MFFRPTSAAKYKKDNIVSWSHIQHYTWMYKWFVKAFITMYLSFQARKLWMFKYLMNNFSIVLLFILS